MSDNTNTNVESVESTESKFCKMQHGRAVFLWNIENLVSTLQELGFEIEDSVDATDTKGDSLYNNGIISARQCFIHTMLSDERVQPMEQQGIETYYRTIFKEFFSPDGEPKLVTEEEINAVGDLVTETIAGAVDAYNSKLEAKEAKEAEVAAKKAEREAKAEARRIAKEAKEAEVAAKKAEREAARREKLRLKEAEKAAKEEQKRLAQEQKARIKNQMQSRAGANTGTDDVSEG